jgi:hypothetical protein
MDAAEFKKDFLDGVKAASATTGEGSCACFAENVSSYLVDNGILPDYVPCYFLGEYKRKKFRIDGYALDEFDKTMNLVVADYDGIETERTLVMTEVNQYVSRAMVFVDAALNSNLVDAVDISTSTSDLIDLLCSGRNNIRKYRIFLFTDAQISSRIKNIDIDNFENVPVEAQVWDLSRLFEVCTLPDNENIEIDFRDYGVDGIPCIEANVGSNQKYKSYLGVIPGSLLSNIYDKYGARLLEGNVRSFLSTKVAVNKQIRATIINSPEMFFAFNNGISVTAKDVHISNINGMKYIVSARDFQIINGGQTTASLYNAKRNNQADLSSIYVQMKLTEIDETQTSIDEANALIRDISRSSNSQNKVSDADFFASHPFHRQMEQISKITYAPALHGIQFETIWFYERARGQYLQEQMRLTPAKKNAFILKNPKNQVITKTDLAKYENTWLEHPDIVSKGAQTNFVSFANYIDEQWQQNDAQFNARYYQSVVAVAIMYAYLNSFIPKQSWYEGGYRANVVTYSIALLHRLVQKQFPGRDINLEQIWNKQELPDCLKDALGKVAKEVFIKITDNDRPVINVTQWCKRTACWDGIQTLSVDLDKDIEDYLQDTSENKHQQKLATKDQYVIKGINAQTEVVKYSAEHWKRLTEFCVNHHIITPTDVSALKIACQLPLKIPNSVQSQHLLDLESKARAEGFKSEDNEIVG